jgi:Rod binding domain-containing protein
VILLDGNEPLAAMAAPTPSQPVLAPTLGSKAVESPRQHKLEQAAEQFESMLLSNLWKSMRSSFEGDDSDFSDPAHGALDDWGMQAMSSAVGKAGGLGIAKLILQHLEPRIAVSSGGEEGASGVKLGQTLPI